MYNFSQPYSNYQYGWGGAWGDDGPTFTITCSGAISTNFTYQPRGAWDFPPVSAVVTENCDATFSAQSGACSNGLGSPEIDTSGTQITGDSNGSRYQANGGATVALTASPSVSASCSTPFSGGSASVCYQPNVTPITITLAGVTVDGDRLVVLTGQRVTATLNGPYTLGYFNWSTSGGAFAGYDPKATTNQLVSITDTTHSSFSFYTKVDGDATVNCNATVLCPDGTLLAVTATQALTSIKPTATVVVDDPTNPLPPPGPGTHFYTDHIGASEYWWPASITVPAPFQGGTGCFAQLIIRSTRVNTRNPTNGASPTYTNKVPSAGGGWVALPPNSLDGAFPYLYGYYKNPDGSYTGVTTGYTWDVATITNAYSVDSPKMYFVPQLVTGDNGGTAWYNASENQSFSTWVMYMPPANGGPTAWLPLAQLSWSWSDTASTDALGNWTVETNKSFSGGAFNNTDTAPTWSSTNAGEQQEP